MGAKFIKCISADAEFGSLCWQELDIRGECWNRLFLYFCSFLCLILRFWNQIFTWRSVSLSPAAISILRGRHRYGLKWNSFSSSSSCLFVKAVLSLRTLQVPVSRGPATLPPTDCWASLVREFIQGKINPERQMVMRLQPLLLASILPLVWHLPGGRSGLRNGSPELDQKGAVVTWHSHPMVARRWSCKVWS